MSNDLSWNQHNKKITSKAELMNAALLLACFVTASASFELFLPRELQVTYTVQIQT